MRRLLNGRERDPLCACQHGPAVHRDGGRCVFEDRCGCLRWTPVPYVYDDPDCQRCNDLAAALRALDAPVPPVIPQPRPPQVSEVLRRAGRSE